MSDNFEKVILKNEVDRALVPAHQSCERYGLITLQAPTPSRRVERLPLNLSLIIDRSGSMSGNKLEYVKEAAIHAVRLLTEADRVSLVIYDDAVEVLAASRAVTADVKNDLIRRIREIRTGGMTNLSGGWFTGCDQIADYMSSDYLNRALLLTDGLANVGLTDHEELVHKAKELRRRGITTTAFGVGHDFNQFLLQGIADAGGGHFYFIDQPAQIPNYFQGELGEMLSTVAREMTLQIDMPNEVEVNLLNDTPHERLGNTLRLFLGDAYAGESRMLLLKLKLPARTLGQTLALSLRLQYEDVSQRRTITLEQSSLTFTVAEGQTCERQPLNEAVLQEAGRMEAQQAKMEALTHEYGGDMAGAQAKLQRAKSALAAAMPAPMAAQFSAEIDELEEKMKQGMTEAARKQSHYDTYLVQRSRKDYDK
jgi:Ca-activated chloride channel family protein